LFFKMSKSEEKKKEEEEEEEEEEAPKHVAKEFDKQKHIKFLMHMLNVLPTPYTSQDTNRVTLIHFVIGSLDLLDQMDKVDKKRIVDFIYAMQVLPDKDNEDKYIQNCGFRGGSWFGKSFDSTCDTSKNIGNFYDQSHIAMTYTAICILLMCDDDLSRLNKSAIAKALHKLQQADGSYSPISGGGENDMRFVYCAAAISYMLNDFSGINVNQAVKYILSSQSFDSAVAQAPGQESHGGSTFCAIAALHLFGRLDDLPRKEDLKRWCVDRQVSGFQGRINKPADTCYSYWIGATLVLLDGYNLVEYSQVKSFTLSCQPSTGGFSKWPNHYPDVLHTYLGLCGMSIGGEPDIQPIHCSLGISKRAAARLKHLH